MHSNNHYNKKLNAFSKDLRKTLTKSEACLWKYCLANNRLGYKFKRQRPVLDYIADFYCREMMLIIELDGITHTYESAEEIDARKEEDLKRNGFTVLRFTDDEVLTQINRVREKILITIEEIKLARDIHD